MAQVASMKLWRLTIGTYTIKALEKLYKNAPFTAALQAIQAGTTISAYLNIQPLFITQSILLIKPPIAHKVAIACKMLMITILLVYCQVSLSNIPEISAKKTRTVTQEYAQTQCAEVKISMKLVTLQQTASRIYIVAVGTVSAHF